MSEQLSENHNLCRGLSPPSIVRMRGLDLLSWLDSANLKFTCGPLKATINDEQNSCTTKSENDRKLNFSPSGTDDGEIEVMMEELLYEKISSKDKNEDASNPVFSIEKYSPKSVERVTEIFATMGRASFKNNDYDAALEYFHKAILLSKATMEQHRKAESSRSRRFKKRGENLVTLTFSTNEIEAVDIDKFYLQPEQLYQHLMRLASIYSAVAETYQMQSSPIDSHRFSNKAVNLYNAILKNKYFENPASLRDERSIVIKILRIWVSVGNVMLAEGNSDAAMTKYQLALKAGLLLICKSQEERRYALVLQNASLHRKLAPLSTPPPRQKSCSQIRGEQSPTSVIESLDSSHMTREIVVSEYLHRNTQVSKEAMLIIAETLNHVAEVHCMTGQEEFAITSLIEALNIYEDMFYKDEPSEVANILDKIATLQYNKGRYNMALKTYRLVVKVRARCFGSKHVSVAESQHKLGTTFIQMKAYEQALPVLKKSLSIAKKHNPVSPICGDILLDLGDVHMKLEKYAYAVRYFRLAGEIFLYVGDVSKRALSQKLLDEAKNMLAARMPRQKRFDRSISLSAVTR